MTIWWLIAILVGLGMAGIAFIWLIVRIDRLSRGSKEDGVKQVLDAASADVEHIFNDEFREELRNRGRLHFEKIFGENAMFLQQDLRLTTSQLNEYMKQELTSKLREEFTKYEESITDAKQMAVDSIQKTKETIEDERQQLLKQLNIEVEAERTRLVKQFEENMAEIVNHYVLAAIGKQIDLSDQLEYIISELEANKQAITEDIKHGA
jgi:F0F1-type ATP synthase membrane subunit b/b'